MSPSGAEADPTAHDRRSLPCVRCLRFVLDVASRRVPAGCPTPRCRRCRPAAGRTRTPARTHRGVVGGIALARPPRWRRLLVSDSFPRAPRARTREVCLHPGERSDLPRPSRRRRFRARNSRGGRFVPRRRGRRLRASCRRPRLHASRPRTRRRRRQRHLARRGPRIVPRGRPGGSPCAPSAAVERTPQRTAPRRFRLGCVCLARTCRGAYHAALRPPPDSLHRRYASGGAGAPERSAVRLSPGPSPPRRRPPSIRPDSSGAFR